MKIYLFGDFDDEHKAKQSKAKKKNKMKNENKLNRISWKGNTIVAPTEVYKELRDGKPVSFFFILSFSRE